MSRLLLLLAFLTLASPALATGQSAQLGVRLQLAIQLPSPGMELVGLPDLGGLALYSAPQFTGNQLRLELLPLRSGPQTIPPLSLRNPQRQIWQTEPIIILVADGLDSDTAPAALKPFPTAPPAATARVPLGYLLLALLTLLIGWHQYRTRTANSATAEPAATPATRLKELADRLRTLEQQGLRTPDSLRRQLEQLRFGPAPASAAAIADCERMLDDLERQPEGSP